MKLTELKKLKGNPRTISKEDMERLKESIKKFGVIEGRPFLVSNRTGENIIIGGNQRYEACKALGIKEVPVHIMEGLTEEQEREIIIRDNVSNGEWDMDILANEWEVEQLKDWGVDIDFETVEPTAEEDDFEVDEGIKTDIVLGDLFEIGPHRLLCGDSTNIDDVNKLMNGEKADCGHNDPPYGMKKEKDGVLNDNLNFDDLLEFNGDWISLQFTVLKDNGSFYCWGIDEPLMDIYSNILKPYIKTQKATFRNLITWNKSYLKNGGTFNPFGASGSKDLRSYPIADEKCLFVMCGVQGFNNNADNYFEGWEGIRTYLENEAKSVGLSNSKLKEITGVGMYEHWFTKSQWTLIPEEHYKKLQGAFKKEYGAFKKEYDELKKEYDELKKEYDELKKEYYSTRAYFENHDESNNVWNIEITNGEEKKDSSGHATPKPLELCARAIKSSCPENGLVIDFFLGSGSTMVASHQLNRRCYGLELDEKYCQVILNRMQKLAPDIEIKRNGILYEKPEISG